MSTVRRWRVRKLRLTSSSHWWSRVHDRGSFPSSPPTGRDAFAECRRYAVLSAAAPPASCPRVPPVPERTELSCRTWESSEPVWIVFGRRFDASGQRAGCSLNGDDLPELGREVRLHIVRTRQQSSVARADDLLFGIERRDFLYPGQGDGRIERSQSPQHCRIQGDVVRLRVSLGAFASLHHRRTREPYEYRLSEVRMSNHQLPFLEVGDVDYIHRPIGKAPEWKIADLAGVGDESGAARRNVRQAVADLANRGNVMCAPALAVFLFHSLQHIAEPGVEIRKGLDAM